MSFFKKTVSPLLDRFDSESMHHLAVSSLSVLQKAAAGRRLLELVASPFQSHILERTLFGVRFENPLIVGAGWDKNAKAIVALRAMGFAGVEIGTVVQHPQPGNPRPRQFMIGKGVALNALGFNSEGVVAVESRLDSYGKLPFPLGVNIGKNKDVPNEQAARAHADVAARLCRFGSYLTINVSSPNTPDLRKLQDKSALLEIVTAVREAQQLRGVQRPTFVKIAPDLTPQAVDDVIDVALSTGLQGIVATNTTNNASIKLKYGAQWENRPGGVSGDDEEYRRMSTSIVSHIRSQTKGALTIIGVGGVKDGATAVEKLQAGADLLQVMTAIRGEGPRVAGTINRGIAEWMENNGVRALSEIVGLQHANLQAI